MGKIEIRQGNALNVLAEILVPAKAFDDRASERRFLNEFRTAGRVPASCGFAAGGFISLMGFAYFQSGIAAYPSGPVTQYIRLLNVLVFVALITFLVKSSVLSVKHYRLSVGFGAFFAMWSLGLMTLTAALENPEHRGKFLVAIVIGILIIYSFMRLPVLLPAAACASSAFPVYLASAITEDGHQYGVMLYLFVANAVGWILCIQIERRERRVFVQTQELKALGAELETRLRTIQDASVVRDRIVHGVAHDLQQPLVSLELYLAQLGTSSTAGVPIVGLSQFQNIRSCLRMMHSGIADLLKENGALAPALERERLNIHELIEDVIRVLEVQARQKKVEIRLLKSTRQPLYVESNNSALREVFLNLIGNAIKFRNSIDDRNSFVAVRVIRFEDSIRVDVWDNGVGISEKEIDRAFEPYWRSNSSEQDGVPGLGLGLSVVRDLLGRLPGHRVALDSKIAKGTRVRVRLPAA